MIHQKLFEVQQKLKAPKGQLNKFGGYNYRSCEDILEAVKPLLQENNLILCLSDEMREVGGRVYVQATATLADTETGEGITTTAFAREEAEKKGMDSSQITGAASSYARKYALSGLLCIDDTKDSDATNTGEKMPDTGSSKKPGKDTPAPQKAQPAANISDEVAKLTQHDEQGYFIKCADCGKPMRDQPRKDGSVYSVQDYAAACLRTYGRPVCKTCRERSNVGQAT